jgi:hypothetical protein
MSSVGSMEIETAGQHGRAAVLSRIGLRLQSVVQHHPWRSFSVFSVFYFAVAFSLSSLKLLWLDELITLHIARLGSLGAIWHALEQGVDPNPPVTYLLVHLSQIIFGSHEYAYRLPAIVGYWVGLLALFAYLKSRLPSMWALAGAVLSACMGAFEYSYESRSYGIFYGLAMLAMFCWSVAADSTHSKAVRYLALLGMALALATGISTNYFAVLAFLPIAAGEAVRSIFRARTLSSKKNSSSSATAYLRVIDLPVWLGLLVAALPLAAYRPLINHAIAQFAPYAWNKVSLDQAFDSYTEMVETILYPLLALFALTVFAYLIARRTSSMCPTCRALVLTRWLAPILDNTCARVPFPAHEIAAAFFFMLYPFLGYLVASIRGGMLSPRFVIPVCFGFAIAGTAAAYQLFAQLRLAGVVFLCFFMAWFISRESVVGYWYAEQKQSFYKVLDSLPQADSVVPLNAPIVISDPLMALTLQHYAPPNIATRVVFPVDFPAIRHFRGDDSPEENLWAGRNLIYTLPILPLATFQNRAGSYLLLAGDGNWMVSDLKDHCYTVKHLPIDTRAEAIGGFTPLGHGIPAFYTVSGTGGPTRNCPLIVPFVEADNLPQAKTYAPVAGAAQ